jgi:choice-of-anchor A domain-containing protein
LSQTVTAASVAGGGSVDLVQTVIATDATSLDDVLIAGVDLKARNSVVHGNAVYGGSSQLKNVVFDNGGAALQGAPVDFAAASQSLTELCDVLGASAATGTAVVAGSSIDLTGTDPVSNVFHVAVAAINAASTITLSVPADAAAIIVAGGTESVTLRRVDVGIGPAHADEVLWAFCDTTSVDLERQMLAGSLVAPNAEVRLSDVTFTGTLAGAAMDAQSLVTSSAPFTGCIKPGHGGSPGEPPPCAPKKGRGGPDHCK